jgi:hypothetical protein
MDRQLLLTITISQARGDSAGDWLQKGQMALQVNAQHQSTLGAAHSHQVQSISLLGQGKPCRLHSNNKQLQHNVQQLPAQSSFVLSPVNLSVGPRQAMQVALNKQQQLLLLFSCF